VLVDAEGGEHISLVPPCRLVNATGAGDSMVAGFLAKVDEGADYDTALRFASCCGSATAASRGLAKKATVERYFVMLEKLMAEKGLDEHGLSPDYVPKSSEDIKKEPAGK
jgi:1-phosphofructokinase